MEDDGDKCGASTRIKVRGPISETSWWSASYCDIRCDIAEAVAAGSKLIILDIDSPGGAVSGLFETVAAIEAARKVCNVVAYVPGIAASAAALLAMACDRIFAAAPSSYGCVGAVIEIEDDRGIDTKLGAKFYRYTSDRTPRKNPEPGTAEMDLQMQARVNGAGDAFLGEVGRLRGIKGGLDMIAAAYQQGAMLPAVEALAAGWIDEIVAPGDASMNWLTLGGSANPPPVKYSLSPARAPMAAAQNRRLPMGAKSSLVVLLAAGFTGLEAVEDRGIFIPSAEADRLASTLTTAQATAEANAAKATAAESAKAAAEAERDTLKAAVNETRKLAALDKHQGRLFAPGQRDAVSAKMDRFGIDETVELLALGGGNAGAPLAAKGDPTPAAVSTVDPNDVQATMLAMLKAEMAGGVK